MDRFVELGQDLARLWEVYHKFYFDGIVNTLILALVATFFGCVIGLVCGMGDAARVSADISCEVVGDSPESITATVDGNEVTLEFVS